MKEIVDYDIRNAKRKKKEKVNSINTEVNTLILRHRERVTKRPHNVEHLVIESEMDFNWKQTDGINTINTEKAAAQT